MRTRFNWDLDEELGGEPLEGAAIPRRRSRLFWGLLILIAAIFALFYWQQSRRLRLQEDAVKEDIMASFRLWHQAVTTGDLELFLFQLSNQDAVWQSGQRELFVQGRLLQRPELGLELLPGGGAPEIIEVHLAPDWQSGTVIAGYAYRPVDGGPDVHLQRVHYFRKLGQRWLLSPGDVDFWGPLQRVVIQGLTLLYPQRDAAIARRLAQDLWDDLQAICAALPDPDACVFDLRLTVRLEREAYLLASMADSLTPVFRSGDFVLPAPTLVGLPQDDEGYYRLYESYTARILNSVRQNLSPPIALPEQALQLLCFPADGRTLRLYRYDVRAGAWQDELSHRALRYLIPGPNDDGVIVQEFTRGSEATRLRLYWWRDGREQLIYDRDMLEQTRRPAGWSDADQPHLLLQGFRGAGVSAQHLWLDLDHCGPQGCAVVELSGYTVWSPSGEHTLVLDQQTLWRGDLLGRPLAPVGPGLSPFWIDDRRYGYVRYDREAGAPSMQIATGLVGEDLPHIVMPVTQLAELLDAQDPPLLFINYVAVNPADRDQLLLAATTVGAATAKYNFFSLRLSSGQVRLVQQFERLPSGYPSLLTPAGYPPFRLSPDGRWLLTTLLASPSPTVWTFHLSDLQQERSLEFNAYYPQYPAQYPFYDWTADGRWLAIVEDGFLRLIAPGYDYQKLVSHRLNDCFYVAWVDGT